MQNGTGHTLSIDNRARVVVTGVEDVDCFNEQIVVLRTPLGELTLTGEGLNIAQLNLEEGRLIVEGELAAAEYARHGKAPGRGLWGKLLR
jgi:sporulation protein YabP